MLPQGLHIFLEALDQMDKFKLGVAIIINKDKELLGILTDGDIRRTLIKNQKPLSDFHWCQIPTYLTNQSF